MRKLRLLRGALATGWALAACSGFDTNKLFPAPTDAGEVGAAGWSYDADSSAHAGRGGAAGRGGGSASTASSHAGRSASGATTTGGASGVVPGSSAAGADVATSTDGDSGAAGASGADGIESGGGAARSNGGATARAGAGSGGRGGAASGTAAGAGTTTGAGGSHGGATTAGGHGGAGAAASGGRGAAAGMSGSTSGGLGGRADTSAGSSNDAGRAGGENGGQSEFWFSEYVEGSSKYKALEIRGLAGTSLSGCRIETYRDGSLSPNTLSLDALIADTGTYVLCSSSLADVESVHCDRSTNLLFNGNDAVALVCNGATLDVIGQIGVDPGDAWTDGDASTVNQTLRRRCGVTTGDPDGNDAFDPVNQWVALPADTVDGLGDGACG